MKFLKAISRKYLICLPLFWIAISCIAESFPDSFGITNDSISPSKATQYINEIWSLKNEGNHLESIQLANQLLSSEIDIQLRQYYSSFVLNSKGLSHKRMGNYFLSYVNTILSYEYARQNRTDDIYGILNNIGTLLLDMNELEKSIAFHQKILAVLDKNINPALYSRVLSNLAIAYLEDRSYSLAEKAFLTLFDFPAGNSFKHVEFDPIIARRNYGLLLKDQHEFDHAILVFEEVLMQSQVKYGQNSFHVSKCCFFLAQCFESLGMNLEAEKYLNIAIQIPLEGLSDSLSSDTDYEAVLIDCIVYRGEFQLRRQNFKKSFEDFKLATQRIEKLIHSHTSESTRFTLSSLWIDAFKKGTYCSMQLYKEFHDDKYLDQAIEWSTMAKSLSLYWLIQKDHLYPGVGLSLDSLLLMQSLKEDIQVWMDNIDLLDFQRPMLDTAELHAITNKVINYEAFEMASQDKYLAANKLNNSRLMTKDINSKLGRNENYLGFQDLDSIIIVFIINRKGRHYSIIKSDSSFRENVESFKLLTSKPRYGQNDISELRQYSQLSYSIYKSIFDPFKNLLVSNQLVIHPDGLFLGLPFEALVTRNPEHNLISYKSLDFLIKDFHTRYVASPFLFNSQKKTNLKSEKTLIISCNKQNTSDDIGFKEAVNLSDMLKKSESIGLSTFTNDYKHLIQEYNNIHIATHLEVDQSNFFKSKLVCESGIPEVHGLSFQDIIFSTIPGTDIYINSCESGGGPLNHGEGLMSLGYAFTLAGAGSIIQHYWNAADHSSTEIALKYYQLRNNRKSENALRRAKIKYFTNTTLGRDHPFYWAGAVYFGPSDKLIPLWQIIIFCLLLIPFTYLLMKTIKHFRGT